MTALELQSHSAFEEAVGFMKTLERHLASRSRFNNDLLYGLVSMSFEKLFVSYLAHHKKEALHHTPLALHAEANRFKTLPVEFKETAKLIQQFESICSFDGFGYRTPKDEELTTMIYGLTEIRQFVGVAREIEYVKP